MYARGYRTWFNIFQIASREPNLPVNCLSCLQTAFPNLPWLPENIDINNSFTNIALAKGTTTWVPTPESGHLPSFQEEILFNLAWDQSTRIIFSEDPKYTSAVLAENLGSAGRHIPVLLQAWAYILSARWAEIVPDACLIQYGKSRSTENLNKSSDTRYGRRTIEIDVGEVSKDAADWWNAILTPEHGWDATIQNKKGEVLHSPWHTTITSECHVLIQSNAKSKTLPASCESTSLEQAYVNLTGYCSFHGIVQHVVLAALAAALLIPVTKYDGRPIVFSCQSLISKGDEGDDDVYEEPSCFTIPDQIQLDRLLTLSCHPRGIKALLTSVFFEPDVASNVCGMWLRGSFAYLNDINEPHCLLRTLIKRDPDLGFLWFGAFITGSHQKSVHEGRGGWWSIDLVAAAWTGTLMSFIQTPVQCPSPGTVEITRANECRLLYLYHDINYTTTPLFPLPPFGSTALEDTNLEVREHYLCGVEHGLNYSSFTWNCRHNQTVKQAPEKAYMAIRSKYTLPSVGNSEVKVDEDDYDSDDDTSEMVTRNIFTWLRGEDGFPVAERAIREHEWIDNLDSDDDTPIEDDVRSTAGGRLHGWLIKISTQRSNSL